MKNFNTKRFKSIFVLVIVFALSSFNLNAQTSDSLYKPVREFKNTIRFNITNPLIFGERSLIFGYERQLKNNRSFSINFGQAALPNLEKGFSDEFREKTILSQRGLHFSGDYRFYLYKLNKYSAPRGVYLGPYYAFNSFRKGHEWNYYKDGSTVPEIVKSNLNFNINQIGIEMGYQFVFWKRFSVDMILLGPGVAAYKIKAELAGNLSDADRQLFFEKLNQALKDKFPGYSGTIGDNSGEFETKGTRSTTSLGFRYMINLGYRF
jgi:hypothetical protein